MLERETTCCPRCRSALRYDGDLRALCTNADCLYASKGFFFVYGHPVLIDFENSIFDEASYKSGCGSVLQRSGKTSIMTRILKAISGDNPVSGVMLKYFITRDKTLSATPRILIIGSGAFGSVIRDLYSNSNLKIVGTDVYASEYTALLADGHRLPFRDTVFDGVWIQAVLEHVLEPQTVVNEIHRVLRSGGVVYADTPFIQQVHEQAYDFTRFTLSGHRWLFRYFTEIDSGAVGGAAVALRWSVQYWARSLGVGSKISQGIALPFVFLRFFEKFAKPGENADGASGVFFLGVRAEDPLHPKDMIAFYNTHRGRRLANLST